MIFSYLRPSRSILSLIPQPIAVIRAFTSLFAIIFCITACSVLRILPLSGRIAWNLLSRPDFALPPAESPSTINSSVPCFPLLLQSASLPGNTPPARTFFLRTVSFANFAASLALAARSIFAKILSNSSGFSAK